MAAINKTLNPYARLLSEQLYADTPKAVFAAIAVGAALNGGNYHADAVILREWWALYHRGIVPQKPKVREGK